MNISFWEKRELFENIDFCITGGGIVGLHTALFLKKRHPNSKILVLEKALIGAAASSKNAGFACFGSVSEILDDIKTIGAEQAFELIDMRYQGLQLLIGTNGKEGIGLNYTGGYELFTKKDQELYEECEAFIPDLNKNLAHIGPDVYQKCTTQPYPFRGVENILFTPYEGQVDTAKMYFNLEQKVLREGITILRGFEVKQFTDIETVVEIDLGEFTFKAGKLLITNNSKNNKK